VDEAAIAPAVRTMRTLNAGAARAALANGVTAATDVTGFGLLGHLGNILASSGLGAEIHADALPVLDGALGLAEEGIIPGGTERNLEAANETTDWDPSVSTAQRLICTDAQTSGGLLLAVAPERLDALLAALRAEHTPAQAVIGRLLAAETGAVHVDR
jgi:selenide,water dikinase